MRFASDGDGFDSCLQYSDVMMPELDGFGLLREVRAKPETRTIPIILLSARAGEESRVEGLDAGADDYLVKKFSARELIARVQTQLQLADQRGNQHLRNGKEHDPRMLRLSRSCVACLLRDRSAKRTRDRGNFPGSPVIGMCAECSNQRSVPDQTFCSAAAPFR